MKARKLLKQYAEGQRNFQGVRIQGQSFKNQDLSGADFSRAHIQGTDFTNACLRGAKFVQVTAGLKPLQAFILVGFLLACLSIIGFVLSLAGLFIFTFFLSSISSKVYLLLGYCVGILLLQSSSFFVKKRYNIAVATWGQPEGTKPRKKSDLIINIFYFGNLISCVVLLINMGFIIIGDNYISAALTVLAITNTMIVFSLALGLAGAAELGGFLAFFMTWLGLATLSGSVARALVVNQLIDLQYAVLFLLIFNIFMSIVYLYVINLAVEGNYSFSWIRLIFVNYFCSGGTSFRGSDLTDANFTQSFLKGTDFRESILNNVCFYKAEATNKFRQEKLNYSILSNSLTLNLLVTLEKELGKSYAGANLSGAYLANAQLQGADLSKANLSHTNLRGANLQNAKLIQSNLSGAKLQQSELQGADLSKADLSYVNFSGANLQDTSLIQANLYAAQLQNANLHAAKLVQAQLDGANLTGATLTSAYIEEWNITTSTKLNGIQCKYIFMRLPPKERPAFIALPPEERDDPNPHRKPEDWDKNFEDGDFADFIGTTRLTLDLYHNKPVDPRLVAIAFEQLREKNPDAKLEIISIEKKGENKNKLLVRTQTSPQANHSQLHSDYFTNIEYLDSLPPEAHKALLTERGFVIALLATKQSSPDILINNSASSDPKQIQGDVTMTDSRQIHAQNYREINVRDQAQYAEGDINNYAPEQRQTLAEAAAEIQELLEQLDKTYPTNTVAGQMQAAQEAIKQIDSNMPLADRILSAVRVGGTEALKQTLNHPAATFVLALIDDWQKTKGS